MLEDYKSALRAGQRAYRARIARGQSPYLAVLDDVLKGVDAVGQRLQKAAQQAARRLVHGNQQLAFFQQRVQRGLGQAGLPLGKDIVAELGAQPRGPSGRDS